MNVNGIFPQAQCFRGKGFGHLIRKQMENSRNSVLKKRHALDDVFEKQQNDIDKSDEGLNKKVSFCGSMLFEQYFSNKYKVTAKNGHFPLLSHKFTNQITNLSRILNT